MKRQRSFDEMEHQLEHLGFTLTQPNYRFVITGDGDEFDEAYCFMFDNLEQVTAFMEGFETAMEIMMP